MLRIPKNIFSRVAMHNFSRVQNSFDYFFDKTWQKDKKKKLIIYQLNQCQPCKNLTVLVY